MYRYLLLFVSLVITLNACTNLGQEQASGSTNISVIHKDVDAEANKVVANLAIDGMTCSAGCGGKIQQELRVLAGVVNTTLDFAEGRNSNIVSVEFDPAKISESEMIKCVGGIGDGQYRVTGAEILHYKSSLPTQSTGNGGTNMMSDNFGKVFQLLNLLQSVARMTE